MKIRRADWNEKEAALEREARRREEQVHEAKIQELLARRDYVGAADLEAEWSSGRARRPDGGVSAELDAMRVGWTQCAASSKRAHLAGSAQHVCDNSADMPTRPLHHTAGICAFGIGASPVEGEDLTGAQQRRLQGKGIWKGKGQRRR